MSTIGFLHTARSHDDRFRELVEVVAPGTEVLSVVDEVLLDRARSHGSGDLTLIGGIADRLAQFVDADVVVCTCSTIGGLAEEIGAEAGVLVRRVDRTMMERAVEIGPRIAVIAAVDSTVAATTDLLRQVAVAHGVEINVDVEVVDGAWACFERDDLDGYESLLAGAVVAHASDADVVVLAQASMERVAERTEVADVGVPVLTSPQLAVASAIHGA